ncbi:MAG: AtuA-related protein [Geminicoccaceae bacterium]
MRRSLPLHEVAHARAGDKGNRSNVSVFAFQPGDYPAIKAQITSERLKATFPDLLQGQVERFALDHLHGLNFVMDQGLEGGVNGSLNLDAHGKSWSFLLLRLTVEVDRDEGS